MRIYELCLIFHNDTTDELLDQTVQSIAAIIARHSGSVLKTEKWGKKSFKYLIKKQSKGHYCFVIFEAETTVLSEIERSIMYNESILRYNFIRLEKFVETQVDTLVDTQIDTQAEAVADEAKADTAAENATETVGAQQTDGVQE